MAVPATLSTIKAYSVPLILFAVALFYQLVVLPRSFPPSHYDVLGVKRYSSIEAVQEAYEKHASTWSLGEVPSATDFLKIRYAYELLVHPLWKRDYDIYGIDEQLHVLDKLTEQHAGEDFLHIDLPLLDAAASDHRRHAFNLITSEVFPSTFNDSKPRLIQVYSDGSYRCAQFSDAWKKIALLLDGIANIGMVELGEIHLAAYLAERKPTGQFFFRSGIPSIIAFPTGCKAADCIMRFNGQLSVDAVTDWFATTILGLPRIFYYTKESLGKDFLAKSGPHKVNVILFSKTGERATPFVRHLSMEYRAYASFAYVLWREEDSFFWWNTFEVESAPAIVILKDPGVKPIVYHGSFNNSRFLEVVEQNKEQVLPQLRSVTSMELGCDARGYSRAGNDNNIWYCVILAGRLSPELNKMRETMRRVQGILLNGADLNAAQTEQSLEPAATAFRSKRLTFAWLDGEAQERYCHFYLYSESTFETCGARRDMTDVPKIFIVRYKRNATKDIIEVERKPQNIWSMLQNEEVDPASQLVVRYNGSDEIPQIIEWVSKTIKDGDSSDLPFYRAKTPELVPEDADPIWSRGAKSILSKSSGMKQRVHNIINRSYTYLGDPRVGPSLLLAALMSFGTIWLLRSQQPARPTESGQSNQSNTEGKKTRTRVRDRSRNLSKKDQPSSITDEEPKNAYQMPFSDTDTE